MVWTSQSAHTQQQAGDAGQQQLQHQQQLQQQQLQQQNGNNASAMTGGNLGAEYTLQGVMRFLQTEWHKHERDRNAWEIERAEMKARIAKLEGENRAEKRLQQVAQKRVQMLEAALKKERMKSGGEGEELEREGKVELSEKTRQSFEDAAAALCKAETDRSKTRQYLEKCLQEITYLLTPPSHPAPQPPPAAPVPQQQSQASLYASEPPNRPPQQPLPQQPSGGAYNSGFPGNPFPPYPKPTKQPQQPPTSAPEPPRGKDTNPFSGAIDLPKPPSSTGDDEWDFSMKPEDTSDPANNGESSLSSRRSLRTGQSPPLIRRKSSNPDSSTSLTTTPSEEGQFKVKFAMRGHLDVIRAVVFTFGGTSTEPEIATAGDDGVIKRWFIPGSHLTSGSQYGHSLSGANSDVDVTSHFTHRGHNGMITSLAACPAPGGQGDGWLFSGSVDATVKIWSAGSVAARAELVGHTDAVWALCVLPNAAPTGSSDKPTSQDRVILASGSADGTIKIWSITPPPAPSQPHKRFSSVRGLFDPSPSPSSPPTQIETSLLLTITRPDAPTASPTYIAPLSPTGETFVVSWNDAAVITYETSTGEERVRMQSGETYDGTPGTGVSCVVASTVALEEGGEVGGEGQGGMEGAGATGREVVIAGTEDRMVRIFDGNSGQCTYTMLAHPASISSLALSPDGKELVSGGHDASLRVWDMEKRSCRQEVSTAHRLYRGEGVTRVVWSEDGRWVVSAGGDGVVKVYAR